VSLEATELGPGAMYRVGTTSEPHRSGSCSPDPVTGCPSAGLGGWPYAPTRVAIGMLTGDTPACPAPTCRSPGRRRRPARRGGRGGRPSRTAASRSVLGRGTPGTRRPGAHVGPQRRQGRSRRQHDPTRRTPGALVGPQRRPGPVTTSARPDKADARCPCRAAARQGGHDVARPDKADARCLVGPQRRPGPVTTSARPDKADAGALSGRSDARAGHDVGTTRQGGSGVGG
jgi:hypothetical protein